jgi:hypothetical protein
VSAVLQRSGERGPQEQRRQQGQQARGAPGDDARQPVSFEAFRRFVSSREAALRQAFALFDKGERGRGRSLLPANARPVRVCAWARGVAAAGTHPMPSARLPPGLPRKLHRPSAQPASPSSLRCHPRRPHLPQTGMAASPSRTWTPAWRTWRCAAPPRAASTGAGRTSCATWCARWTCAGAGGAREAPPGAATLQAQLVAGCAAAAGMQRMQRMRGGRGA